MNIGPPSDSEKDQVKINQQSGGNQTPSPIPAAPVPVPRPSPTPKSVPPLPPPTPRPTPPAVPASPTPTPPAAPSSNQTSNIPLQTTNDKKDNIGVGADNIGVEKNLKESLPEETAPAATIEVQTSDIPIKTYDQNKTTEKANTNPTIPTIAGQPLTASPKPPIKAGGNPAATITVIAILALIFGGSGGFLGFRYYDKIKTSASTLASPSPQTSGNSSSPSTDTANWPTYSNTVYNFSLKYPTGWVSNTTDPKAENIILASNQESLSASPSGSRVEIVFQDTNGQTLKSWVEANAVTTKETKPIKEITVSGQTAYQQEQTNIQPAVTTFIERPDKVMTITLSAPPELMNEGGEWYNKIINSITLS